MPELYLGRFAEFKNGIKVDFGAKIRIYSYCGAPCSWAVVAEGIECSQRMPSYNSTCRFNTAGDRRAACTIQGAGGRRVVFYIYIRERVPVGEYGHIIHQNAGNREPVDLVR